MLEVKDATIEVGGQTLVTGFSLMAKDGAMTCITGREGSGKTTLIRALMGFLPVAQGFVSVDGELLTIHSSHAFRGFMTYLPQASQTLRHQLMPPEAAVCEPDEYGVWNAVLPTVRLEQPAEPLSAEDIFRLEEATLRESDRPIVIADEPAAYLTPELTQRLLALLMQKRQEGKTVLVASRNPLLVARADHVIDLDSLRK